MFRFAARSALVFLGFFALTSCISQEAHRSVLAANEALQKERSSLAEYNRGLEAENARLSRDVQRLGASAVDAVMLQQKTDEVEKLRNDLLARLGTASGAGGDLASVDAEGVTVRRTAEGVVFQVQGEVLFSSGQAELSESGRRTLDQILPSLTDGRRLRVEGHTDTDPIQRSRWRTNLRLSSERALSVAEYLTGAGFQADHVAVAGYGEHRPIAAGADDAAKAANRRVEILLLDL